MIVIGSLHVYSCGTIIHHFSFAFQFLISLLINVSYQFPIPTEDKAVEVICAAMKWGAPRNWRHSRKKYADLHDIPVLDLAEWDRRVSTTQNASHDSHNATNPNDLRQSNGNNDNHNDDRQEEKKDCSISSTEEYIHC